jgi:hypothetical protein
MHGSEGTIAKRKTGGNEARKIVLALPASSQFFHVAAFASSAYLLVLGYPTAGIPSPTGILESWTWLGKSSQSIQE